MEKGTKVYVYKEYSDNLAYGEELIEVYSSIEDARKRLRERAEAVIDADYLNNPNAWIGDDTVSEDYISVALGRGVSFWVIEEKIVQ